MTEDSNGASASLYKRLLGNRLFCFLTVAAIFTLLVGVSTPLGGKWYLQKWLIENGAEVAVIDKLRINPFNGSVTLYGADVQRNGQVVFSNNTIHLNLNLWKLFSKSAYLDQVTLANVFLDIEQHQEKGLRIASYELISTKDTEVPEVASKESVDIVQAAPWIVHAQRVDMSNVTLHYKRPDLDLLLVVEEGYIDRLGTSVNDRGGEIKLKGTVNGAPLVVDAKIDSLLPGLKLDGNIQWTGFDLSSLENLLKDAVTPFKGLAGIKGDISMEKPGEGDLTVSYSGTVSLENAEMGAESWAVKGKASWKGKIIYDMTPEEGALDSVKVNGELGGEEIAVLIPGIFSLDQQGFTAKSRTDLFFGGAVRVDSEGIFNFTTGTYSVEETATVKAKDITWKGRTGYHSDDKGSVVMAEGELAVEQVNTDLFAQGIVIEDDTLQVDSNLHLKLGGGLNVEGQAKATLKNVKLSRNEESFLSLAELNISGLKGNETGGLDVGIVEASKISLPISQTVPVAIDVSSVLLETFSTADFANISIADLKVITPVVTDVEQQLAILESIGANNIQVDKNGNVNVGSVTGVNGSFLRKPDQKDVPMLTLKEVKAEELTWGVDTGFVSRQISFDSLFANLARKKANPAEKEQEVAAVETDEESHISSGLPIKIDRIQLIGNSGLQFKDETLTTPFATSLLIKKGEITGIDFNTPQKPFIYMVMGSFDKYSPIKLEGECAPLAEALLIKNKTVLQNYPLQKLSPYVVDAIGTYFKSGQLDVHSEMVIKGDDLDVKSNYLFKGLEVETVDGELAAKLDNALPVSLELALSMLRDNDGNIDLDVPISGKVSDLDIGLTDIIVTAMSKAIAVSVAPYLAYTFLGPTGALVYLGAQLGQTMLATDLPSLSFEIGQGEFTEEQQETLNSVGKSIAGSSYSYSICSRVSLAELGEEAVVNNSLSYAIQNEESRKQLFEIGESRSLTIKQFLLDNFKIDEERLLICNPGFSMEKDAKTSVEFMR